MPTALELINKAEGKSLTQIAKQGVGGWLLALSVAFITGLQKVVSFLLLPFELFTNVGREVVQGFFIEPLGLIPIGVSTSGQYLDTFEFLGLPAAVGIVLLSFFLVLAATALGITSNVVPGLVVDNPIWDFLFGTPEEEADDEG